MTTLEPMAMAMAEARAAFERGEVPVGAVIVRDGRVLASAGNRTLEEDDPTAHAEMLAIREASAAAGSQRLAGADLYVTLEPCAMCAGGDLLRPAPAALFRRARSEGRRRRARSALLRAADLPSCAGGLWGHRRGGSRRPPQDVLFGKARLGRRQEP